MMYLKRTRFRSQFTEYHGRLV